MDDISKEPKKGYGFIYLYIFPNGMKYIGQTTKSIEHRLYTHRYNKNSFLDNIVGECFKNKIHFEIENLGEYPISQLNIEESKNIIKYDTLYPRGYNMYLQFVPNEKEELQKIYDLRSNTEWENKVPKYDRAQNRNRRKREIDIFCLNNNRHYSGISELCDSIDVNISDMCKWVSGQRDTVKGYEFMILNKTESAQSDFNRLARCISGYWNEYNSVQNNIEKYREMGRELAKSNVGKKYSEEHCKHISESQKGKELSEETRNKISLAKKGQPGHKHSEETKKHLSEIKKGENNALYGKKGKDSPVSRSVIIFIYPDMKEYARCDTLTQASEMLGVTINTIHACCSGKSKSIKNKTFKVMYADNPVSVDFKVKRVAKCDMNDDIIEIFANISDAKKSMNSTTTGISLCCNGKAKTALGYKWRFIE